MDYSRFQRDVLLLGSQGQKDFNALSGYHFRLGDPGAFKGQIR